MPSNQLINPNISNNIGKEYLSGYELGNIRSSTRIISALKQYGMGEKVIDTIEDLFKRKKNKQAVALFNAKNIYYSDDNKFQGFLDASNRFGEKTCRSLKNAFEVYKDDNHMFEGFAKVAREKGSKCVDCLHKASIVYGTNKEWFDAFVELAIRGGSFAVNEMIESSSIYNIDNEKFDLFVLVGIKAGHLYIKHLRDIHNYYGESIEKLKAVCDVIINTRKKGLDEFLGCKDIYKNNHSRFVQVANLIAKIGVKIGKKLKKTPEFTNSDHDFEKFYNFAMEASLGQINDLYTIKKVWSGSELYFNECVFLIKSGKLFNIEYIYINTNRLERLKKLEKIKNVAENITIFRKLVDVLCSTGDHTVDNLIEHNSIYGDNLKLLDACIKVNNSNNGYIILKSLSKQKRVFAEDSGKFEKLISYYDIVRINDKSLTSKYLELIETKGKKRAVNFLKAIKAIDMIGLNNLQLNRKYVDIYENKGLSEAKEFIRNIANLLSGFDFTRNGTGIHQPVIRQYIENYEIGGITKALEYIEDLMVSKKQLIASKEPYKIRNRPDYPFLIESVFPGGNYSKHETNIILSDKLDHLAGYDFDKNGYVGEVSGIKGYYIKEGKQENIELLAEYQGRIKQLSFFFQQGGNEKEFVNKLDNIYEIKIMKEFKELKNLKLEEKLLVLYLSEVIRKARNPSGFKIDNSLVDLMLLYRYVYQEPFDEYRLRSGRQVQNYDDEITQRAMLWNELSMIYGENLKHNIRNDMIISLQKKSKFYNTIEKIFINLLSSIAKPFQPKDNQTLSIKKILEIPGIDNNTRFNILKKGLIRIFGANINFESINEKEHFEFDIGEILSCILNELSYENVLNLFSKFKDLRNKYLLNINNKLDEIFCTDINLVNSQIANYEQVLLVETKKGGKNVQKSSKKRPICGYFTKTKETTNARMGAHLCIAGKTDMWENKNYFEFVLQDEETGSCLGLVMLLNIDAKDGKKYLRFGPNPFESFLDKVSSKDVYNFMYNNVCDFAQRNNFDGVVIPSMDIQIQGACTNRGGDFPKHLIDSKIKDKNGKFKIVGFGKNAFLTGGYSYSSGALIRERY